MLDFLITIGKAFLWAAVLTTLFVFILVFIMITDSSGRAPQGIVIAILTFPPIIFFWVLTFALLIQIRRIQHFSLSGKILYLILLVFSLIHSNRLAPFSTLMAWAKSISGIDSKRYTSKEELESVTSLTEAERQLLQSTHFNIRVGVVNPCYPATYTKSLVHDLKATALFDEVAELEQMESVDMIATVKDAYYGGEAGQSFSLKPPDEPGKEKRINFDLMPEGHKFYKEERKQYLENLSIELIKSINALKEGDKQGEDPPCQKANTNVERTERIKPTTSEEEYQRNPVYSTDSDSISFNDIASSNAEVQAGKKAFKQKDFKAALNAFNIAIELNPENAVAFNERGSTYFKLNLHDLAIQDFRRAIALQPQGSAHYYHLGNVYYDIGMFERALENYSEAIRLQPDFANFYYMRCLAYKELEEHDKAATDCKKVLEISPEHNSARKQLKLLDKAKQ